MTLRRVQIILILFSFWILAIVLPAVHFAPGNWEVIKQELTGKPPRPEILFGALLAFSAIFFGGLLASSLWRTRRRKKKPDDSRQIYRDPVSVPLSVYMITVLIFMILGGMFWWARQPSTRDEKPTVTRPWSDSPQQQETQLPPTVSLKDSFGAGYTDLKWVGYLLAIGFLAGLSFLAWRGLRGRPSDEETESLDLGRIAAEAALNIKQGAELSDVVLRCYRDMCNILGRRVALRDEMTAREFAQRLQQTGVGRREVMRLTDLFERVRYGRHVAGPDERAEAIALLQTIDSHYGKVADEQ